MKKKAVQNAKAKHTRRHEKPLEATKGSSSRRSMAVMSRLGMTYSVALRSLAKR